MAAKEYKRKDHFYNKAKQEGFRSRAAYKLLEMDKKYRILRPGSRIIDLGCFPGSWLQVAAQKVGKKGLVVGVDLREVESLGMDTVKILRGDFCTQEMQENLLAEMPGKPHVVLSDLSPSLSGIRLQDALRSADLVERAFHFAVGCLLPGGSFVAKIFPGNECEEVAREIKPKFSQFSRLHLQSTRGSSKELYFVARGFKVDSEK